MEYTQYEWKLKPEDNGHYSVFCDGGFIADVFDHIEGYEGNAHLIVASKDMYEALKYIIRELDKADIIKANSIFMEMPNKAIHKAEGK